jgi:hypothetical protein
MIRGFSAGCSLEVTLKFADFENMKPSFWAGIKEEWDTEKDGDLTIEDIYAKIDEAQVACREICEKKIDADIYDVKNVKVFEQINYKKKGGK